MYSAKAIFRKPWMSQKTTSRNPSGIDKARILPDEARGKWVGGLRICGTATQPVTSTLKVWPPVRIETSRAIHVGGRRLGDQDFVIRHLQ